MIDLGETKISYLRKIGIVSIPQKELDVEMSRPDRNKAEQSSLHCSIEVVLNSNKSIF